MRVSKRAHSLLAPLLLVGTLACGGGAHRLYRVAVDLSPLADGKLPASCYVSGTQPPDGGEAQGIRTPVRWIVWDGPSDERFLDTGIFIASLAHEIGDTGEWFAVAEILSGKDRQFHAASSVSETAAGATSTVRRAVTVAFEKMDAVTHGTVSFVYEQTCSGCSTAPRPSACGVVVKFDAAQIPGTKVITMTP